MSALVTYHGNLAVPDSRLAPPSTDYPVDRFSLYEYESLPSTQGTFGKEPGMDGLDQFFQDSTFDFFPGMSKLDKVNLAVGIIFTLLYRTR